MSSILGSDFNELKSCTPISGNIRDLLRQFIERKVVIVLDAEMEPELIEVENVVGNLLIAEFNNKFKFVDIDCICEVIIGRDELLEALLGRRRIREEEEHENHETKVLCTDNHDLRKNK